MAEKATIIGSSTVGADAIESQTPTIADNTASDTLVTNEGNLQNATDTPTAESTIEQEDNAASFDLSFGEENVAQPQGNTAQQQNEDWKQILKKLDRKEVAKELGFDDFDVDFSDFRKKGGDPTKYVTAKSIDWNKVNDIDLVRSEFNAKYPNLSTEDANYLFNKKYVAAEVDDDDVQRDKRIELQISADEIRRNRIAEQQNFKLPEAVEPAKDEAYANYKATIEQLNTNREAFKTFLSNHEATKNLLQTKRVAIPIGKNGSVFNFNVDKPEAIMTALTDGGKTWERLVKNEKGEPDILKQQMIIMYASNPQKFAEDIFNYGKSQGMKAKIEEGQNASRDIGGQPRGNATNTTEKQAWKNARTSTLGAY